MYNFLLHFRGQYCASGPGPHVRVQSAPASLSERSGRSEHFELKISELVRTALLTSPWLLSCRASGIIFTVFLSPMDHVIAHVLLLWCPHVRLRTDILNLRGSESITQQLWTCCCHRHQKHVSLSVHWRYSVDTNSFSLSLTAVTDMLPWCQPAVTNNRDAASTCVVQGYSHWK